MKKLLVLLAAFGLTASTATTVIACDTSNDNDKLVTEVYKKISKPKDINELTKMAEVIEKEAVILLKEINNDIFGSEEPTLVPTKKQREDFNNHKKIQVFYAYSVSSQYLNVNKQILANDKTSAQFELKELTEMADDNTHEGVTFKPSKLNKQKVKQFASELEEDISKLT